MLNTIELQGVKLTPVIELEPGVFSTQLHSSPSGTFPEMLVKWEQYWRACLADSGITRMNPVSPGSWHVATTEFSSSQLENYLRVIINEWGGLSVLSDPDSRPVLKGGLALSSENHGIICEPACCCDLANIEDWRKAASYQGSDSIKLWIGHPYLSMRFQKPWLVLSSPHEFNDPVDRWAVDPNEIGDAVKAAETELIRFSKQIASILNDWKIRGRFRVCINTVSRTLNGMITAVSQSAEDVSSAFHLLKHHHRHRAETLPVTSFRSM